MWKSGKKDDAKADWECWKTIAKFPGMKERMVAVLCPKVMLMLSKGVNMEVDGALAPWRM